MPIHKSCSALILIDKLYLALNSIQAIEIFTNIFYVNKKSRGNKKTIWRRPRQTVFTGSVNDYFLSWRSMIRPYEFLSIDSRITERQRTTVWWTPMGRTRWSVNDCFILYLTCIWIHRMSEFCYFVYVLQHFSLSIKLALLSFVKISGVSLWYCKCL